MARRLYQGILAFAGLYALAVGLFAWFHYPKGETPDAVTAATDMHRAVASLFARKADPVPEPGTIPPPKDAIPAVEPPAGPTEAEIAAATAAEATEKARTETLRRVQSDLLPVGEKLVRAIPTGDASGLDERKSAARVALVEARDALGPILDANRHDAKAQELYHRVMELLIAVDKR